ncbi:MAG TPA: hypothetical protein VGS97_02800 [Actinocrinis sp.]|uniref:hypothetical protein n=1 Tax=Actinocrinis sp. TaxID=1920516 RepID=UPI002DDCE515|nr:hypothetical protein [Actinocrinis sp.]HEV2343000.1 hypothetical protein [Actinocrinis sp.]
MHKWAGDPARRHLADQIKRLAPGAAVVRVRPDGSVSCYRPDRTEIHDRDRAHNKRIGELLRAYYRAVNWAVAHDYYPGDGRLCASPRPGQRGCQPAADRTFGSGLAPLYLPAAPIPSVGPPS